MKSHLLLLSLTVATLLLTGCLRDREFVVTPPSEVVPDTINGAPGSLLINEFVAKGSANANEFGSNEDWIELYNPSARPVHIRAGSVFMSDDFIGAPDLFALPSLTIPGRGFLLLWADDLDTTAAQIHTNFKLSSSGEYLGLSYGTPGNTVGLDSYQYGVQTQDAVSNGRSQDGGAEWTTFLTPTPGARNQ